MFSAINTNTDPKRDPEGFLMGINYWKYVNWTHNSPVLVIANKILESVPVSNNYAGFLTGQVFSSQLSGFTAANYVMLNLPVWVTVIGLIGAVLLVINISRDQGVVL